MDYQAYEKDLAFQVTRTEISLI